MNQGGTQKRITPWQCVYRPKSPTTLVPKASSIGLAILMEQQRKLEDEIIKLKALLPVFCFDDTNIKVDCFTLTLSNV